MRKSLSMLLLLVSSNLWAALPSVSDFTKDMTRSDGYLPFYYDAGSDKIYLLVNKPDTQMLLQTSLPQGVGSNDIGLDRGQLGLAHLIVFERRMKSL